MDNSKINYREGFFNLLGFLDAYLMTGMDVKQESIIRKFQELNDKGLLPDSLKERLEVKNA